MYLKSLTMKGFKSFADATTLDLEPGVTVIVGPNGSGKSNVVDAVAWVLGAQGPSVVRSQKMDDVIFAGTSSRPALGRAEVTLVIDNTSRRLPADLNEVTIRRTIFRDGESEYALNGIECRLLDVQELLSDGGVGRQQHSIISQGQLDSILSARPEDRRIAIEEAAGILKYRRRRERAVRRLEAAKASMVRLGDLLREVRRQIRPLERQATSAERHGALAAELRDVSVALAAAELRAMRVERTEADGAMKTLSARVRSQTERTDSLNGSIASSEERLGADPADRLLPPRARVDRLEERARGISAVLSARERSRAELARVLDEAAGVASLTAARDRLQSELDGTESTGKEIALEWDRLAVEETSLVEAEAAHAGASSEFSHGASEAAAVKRAELTRREIARQVAERHRIATEERLTSLRTRRELVAGRAELAREHLGQLHPALLDAQALLAKAEGTVDLAGGEQNRTERELAAAREERAALAGRTEALELALNEVKSGSAAERFGAGDGVLGALVDLVEVDGPVALAFEAAVHAALDAVIFVDEPAARAAVRALQASAESGSVLFTNGSVAAHPGRPALPPGVTWLADRVRSRRGDLSGLIEELVGGVAVVEGDLDAALDALGLPGVDRVVTVDGDLFSPRRWRIRAGKAGATLDALERAISQLGGNSERLSTLENDDRVAKSNLEVVRSEHTTAFEHVAIVERAVRDAESEETESEALFEVLVGEERSIIEQHEEAVAACVALDVELETERADLAVIEASAAVEQGQSAAASEARTALDDRARGLSMLRRDLEVRAASLEERRGQLQARVEELTAEIDRRNREIVDAGNRRHLLDREHAAIAGLVGELARTRGELAEVRAAVDATYEERRALAAIELDRIAAWRIEREGLASAFESARDERQRLEIEIAQLAVREEAAIDALRRELDISPEEALATAPAIVVGSSTPAARRAELERELRELGPVNLLAKEELDALTERNGFLEHQIEDAQRASKELNGVIRTVDAEITDVFAAAFEDVSRNFELLVATLFPGGSGRLSLTAPDDLLETGVEIEARPAGRTIRRLSLLSGGERSLVALAFLFAIFRSRPSPFYLMDEVEAALDDVNLVRFLALLDEFREDAQLLVVSHQKRTMEIADALYGVTLQPGGASKVVSERLRARSGGGPT